MLPTQSMNLKKVLKKVMYACMSAAMIAVPTVPAYAAQNDVIDTTRTASLTIHKYDIINQSYNMCIFCGLCSYDSIKSIGDWIPAHFNYWNSNVNQI